MLFGCVALTTCGVINLKDDADGVGDDGDDNECMSYFYTLLFLIVSY